ncbi:MAG: alpha/beta family hydrolase [Plesiomonas sp.]|uniref:alpha/beta family hydrolase n=1 Tax=Plesiomonas sp. TaxID=2486279 RepID=UPI003F380888
MNIIAIPGKMPATKTWINQVVNTIGLPDLNLTTHSLQAWQHPAAEFNLAEEVEHIPEGKFDTVVAKSIGTLMTLQALDKLKVKNIIFIGIALSLYSDADKATLRELSENDQVNLLIIQQDSDPFGHFSVVQQAVNSQRCHCIEVQGDDHLYSDVSELGTLISAWLSSK